MSIAQDVAEWIHGREGGAISAEVAAEFSLAVSEASIVIGWIHREPRFITRVEHFCLNGRHTRRIYVDEVNKPKWEKTPVIGVWKDKTVWFPSITSAEVDGGFVGACITRCLSGRQKVHGGYRWQIDTSKGSGKCTATATP